MAGDAALRILGQRSVFVIGRPVVDEGQVDAVEIGAADKEPLRAELEQVDLSERTIYRDLVGFCQLEGANARRARPTTAAAYLRRANGAYSRGEYQEAVEAYGKCLELRAASETYFLRGNANAALGRHQEAIDDYGRALDSLDIAREAGGSIHYAWFPSGIYFNRGNEQACLGMHVDAIADYRRAADAAPLYKSTHFNCGNAYFMQQRYADAVACYDQALALAPQDLPALINKALALVLQGKPGAAEACYRSAQRVGPLWNNTLEPLLELKAAFAGLPESGLTVEVVETGNTLRAAASHPDYRDAGRGDCSRANASGHHVGRGPDVAHAPIDGEQSFGRRWKHCRRLACRRSGSRRPCPGGDGRQVRARRARHVQAPDNPCF